jgi:hypothetical protein
LAGFAFDVKARSFGAQRAPFNSRGPSFFGIYSDAGDIMRSNRRRWAGVLVLAVASAIGVAQVVTSRADEGDEELVLAFSTMRGSVPHVDINGNIGAGAPWVIRDGDGRLTDEGELNLRVRGLVLAKSVPNVGGTNPVPFFRAIVSCTTVDSTGATEVVNFATGPFPADAKGNCRIDADIPLPDPCYAPIVLVGPAAATATPGVITSGTWFAATGF